ncbi:MAG: nucleoid-associated protein YgaU [Planctomycetota bacterium]|jgi:nucleoid-associated protein YgaU
MQRIERYGVMALVLLLVTIAAVSFWDDGSETIASANGSKKEQVAQRKQLARPGSNKPKQVRVGNRELPVTAASEAAPVPAKKPATSPNSRRKELPRKSSKSTFKTLPATVVSPASEPKQKRVAVSQPESNEVIFPSLSKNSANAEQSTKRDTPYVPVQKDTGAKGFARDDRQRNTSTYKVKPGDTLSQIAEGELGSSRRWGEIQTLNGDIDPSSIYVGMILKMPTGGTVASNSKRVSTKSQPSKTTQSGKASGYYTIMPGDSLSMISQNLLGKASRWNEIVALNPGLDADVLISGQRLRVPIGKRSSTNSASVAVASSAPTTRKENRVR